MQVQTLAAQSRLLSRDREGAVTQRMARALPNLFGSERLSWLFHDRPLPECGLGFHPDLELAAERSVVSFGKRLNGAELA